MRDVLPEEVFDGLSSQLREIGNSAHEAWPSAAADEDTVTGDWGGRMRDQVRGRVFVNGSEWVWNANYRKLRGRGLGAPESELGTDGLIEIEVYPPDGGDVVRKGVVFQAKKGRLGRTSELLGQTTMMEHYAPGSSVVLEYGPESFGAVPGREYMMGDGTARFPRASLRSFGDFLSDEFLACEVGTEGLYYDSHRQRLLLPTSQGQREFMMPLTHRVVISIDGTVV